MKEKVLKIRKDQARIGGRKLIYLLQDDFKKVGIRIGRDKFFRFLKAQHLLVKKKRKTEQLQLDLTTDLDDIFS